MADTDTWRQRPGRQVTCADELGTLTKFSLSGGAPCHPSPLDPEPAPSGVVTQTARADMFMASSEIKIYLCINNEKF